MDNKTRRDFLAEAARAGAALPLAAAAMSLPRGAAQTAAAQSAGPVPYTREVPYYEKLKNKQIKCLICPRECVVGDMERGYCGNKENRGGKYVTLAWGNPCAANNDPIEKKPLFHFLPGTKSFSIAAAGCNFDCKFCQNWDISQSRPEQTHNYDLPPKDVAAYAKKAGSASIAYTYGEPVVFYKYMDDCAVAARAAGIRSVMISNGYINTKPLRALCKSLDAVKIDFKAFTDRFYRQTCQGTLKPVLDAMVTIKKEKVWLELVYLVVPTLNDDSKDIRAMAQWIVKNLGADTPVHFTRFHPQYKLKNLPPTPLDTLERIYDTARDKGLRYAYIGNVPGHKTESTRCRHCGKTVIARTGYIVSSINIKKGKCGFCGKAIPGVWS